MENKILKYPAKLKLDSNLSLFKINDINYNCIVFEKKIYFKVVKKFLNVLNIENIEISIIKNAKYFIFNPILQTDKFTFDNNIIESGVLMYSTSSRDFFEDFYTIAPCDIVL
jgi:hypothetical protein